MSGRSALSPEQLRAIHAQQTGGGQEGSGGSVDAQTAAVGAAFAKAKAEALATALRDGTKHPGRKRFSR